MTLDTAAPDAISRFTGDTPMPGDALLAVFDAHSRDDWAAIDVQVVRYAPERCVICGAKGGPECAKCTADWDAKISRTVDL